MESLRTLMNELIRTKGAPPESFFSALLPAFWPRIVGARLVSVTVPGSLRGGRLTVYVRNTVWKQHLEPMAPVFVDRLGGWFPPETVREIAFRSSPARFQPEKPAPRPELPPEDRRWAEQCASAIQDAGLREIFLRTLTARLAIDRGPHRETEGHRR